MRYGIRADLRGSVRVHRPPISTLCETSSVMLPLTENAPRRRLYHHLYAARSKGVEQRRRATYVDVDELVGEGNGSAVVHHRAEVHARRYGVAGDGLHDEGPVAYVALDDDQRCT